MALLSKNKLSNMMLDILLEFPSETKNLKDTIVARLGAIGLMSTTRDLNAAWNETKKKAAQRYPKQFILDGRNVLQSNDGTVKVLDKNISGKNFKMLNEFAEHEQCSVDQFVSTLITLYKKHKKT